MSMRIPLSLSFCSDPSYLTIIANIYLKLPLFTVDICSLVLDHLTLMFVFVQFCWLSSPSESVGKKGVVVELASRELHNTHGWNPD